MSGQGHVTGNTKTETICDTSQPYEQFRGWGAESKVGRMTTRLKGGLVF